MTAIINAVKGKVLPATEQRGELQVWSVTLDDGREAELSRKPDSPAPTGEVTVTETQYGLRAKLVQQGGYGGGGGGKDYKADPAKLRAENARSALHAAKDLVVADKVALDQMGAYTAKFYDYIAGHAKVDE